MVEQRTENPRVGGSIPSLATILKQTPLHSLSDPLAADAQAPRTIDP